MRTKIIDIPTSIEGMILSNINPKINKVKLEHIAFKNCESIEDMKGHRYVLQKKGEWIKIDKYDEESNVQCSVCLEEFDYIDGVCYLCHGYELPLFCPNCGADMRGEKYESNL